MSETADLIARSASTDPVAAATAAVSPLPVADPMENRLRDFFAQNYEILRAQGGHHLAPDVLMAAFLQVLLYWRKLKNVAERVTETEVRLTLPSQRTPAGRTFGIEGVVDIVREDDQTIMYDLKTHDAAYVRANLDQYAPQLNVYAYIWQGLRGQALDETAIISTVLPNALREALIQGDASRVERELTKWEPLVPVPFDANEVQQTIEAFAHVVDDIEDHKFAPPSVDKLNSRRPGQVFNFATSFCRNCDARFSCTSYRAYALKSGAASARTFRHYFQEHTTDADQNDWLTAGLSASEALDPTDFEA